MNIADFFIKIGVSGQESVKNLSSTINETRRAVITMQVAFIGATYALNKFLSGTVSKSTSLENFTKQTGLSTDELNKWVAAGQKVNKELNFDTVKNNVAGLQKQLEQIKIGQGNVAPFQLLGIDATGSNAFGVLRQLRNNIQGLSDAQAVNLIQQLGLDANFINVLRLSEIEFDKLSKNDFLNGKQTTIVANLGRNINDLKIKLQSLKDQAVVKLAPVLTKLLNDLQKWMNENGKKIIQTFSDIANIVTKIGSAIGRVVGLFADLFQGIGNSQNGFTTLALIVGTLMLAFKPFTLLLIGLLLILDDIAAWKAGGNSSFGGLYDAFAKFINIAKNFPGIEHLLKIGGAVAGINLLTGSFSKLGVVLWGIVGPIGKIALAFAAIQEVGEYFKAITGSPNILPANEKEVVEQADFAHQTAIKITDFLYKTLGLSGNGQNIGVNKNFNIQQNIYGNDAKEIGDYATEGIQNIELENQLKN